MIKGLIGFAKISRDATIMGGGILLTIWVIKELNKEMNPSKLINEAESRQISYVDKTVSRIEKRLERIEDKIDRLPHKEIATLKNESSNNKN